MAPNMTETTSRLTLVVGLSIMMASCSTGKNVAGDPSTAYDRDSPEAHAAVLKGEYSDADLIASDAPDVYEVVRGDTLWDIADRFLKEPWRWSEIWNFNPQIADPNLIYPGDVLALEYINGKPTLSLTRDGKTIRQDNEPDLGAATPTGAGADSTRVTLSPRIRSESLDTAVPMIPSSSISPFLLHPLILDSQAIKAAPYIIANDEERLISSTGSKVYARGPLSRTNSTYGVYRKNKALINPVNGEHLGYEVTHVSDARLLSVGDPSTLTLIRNKLETVSGDFLLPATAQTLPQGLTPRAPELVGEARIVSLVNAIAQAGRNQVVVLNVGSDASIQPGDVLAVETSGQSVIDKYGNGDGKEVALPNERTGVLLVFRTFDKVSYALVMESTRPIKINDLVTGI